MQFQNNQQWYNPYRYIGRNLKVFWDANGGKICTVAGTAGLFLTGAHACRKTYKIHDKLSENGKRIREGREKSRKDGLKAFISSAARTAKDYLPDLVAGTLSAYVVNKGWGIEHQNFKEATALAGVIAGSFMNYRQNVIAEHGADADLRYMTTKRVKQEVQSVALEDGTKVESVKDGDSDIVVSVEPNMLRIFYSKETTPQVWSPSHLIRIQHLETIVNKLNGLLICGGHYTINDVRREFYGVKGDIAVGGLFGRVWDPGNPAHPERGAKVNLHYEDDEEFAYGIKDSCWIIIDIDDAPLTELLAGKSVIPGVEV